VMTPAAPTTEAAQAPRDSFKNPIVSPEGVRIVRPAAGESAEAPRTKLFIPMIVGVPSDPVSQGRALLQHGYVQEAIAELQVAATAVGPQLAEANNLLGLAYDRLGWHRQAAEAYARALTLSRKDYVILANLGNSLYLAGDYTGALKRLNQAAMIAPNEPVIQNNLGVVNARLGRHGDAYKHFARASNEYEAHVKLAGILEDQQRDRDAVKHYEAALRLQPGASAVLERLVPLYERTGARDKADTARRALSQPKNPQKTATGGGG
jgi:Flp pilus assembly protein TadD